ncbi:unnamed protein product [Acanthoscelides obtectus]|uniref:Uncharacterized protein n=1 Tax=Acanthoscelides obtectus TaxID=200917 RepID=A0A9P0M0B1_ACAOB|nr:unnamed protein product [Acanthoscelides obtectus]CAK1688852.1 hypothetical protein AOBTE_LOCUS36924 [Acanthoscelides obtectus]
MEVTPHNWDLSFKPLAILASVESKWTSKR